MSKKDYCIKEISKNEAAQLLTPYHYLSNLSKGFKSGFNFGLYNHIDLVGVCIFTGLPVPELSKGMLGTERHDQKGLFELSRFCLEPITQKTEHNLASWFLSRCLKLLQNKTKVRLVLSYADSDFHCGTIYAACNFTYYGLTAPKKDFYIENNDGSFTKHSRGKVKGIKGEWRNRTRKHRFVKCFDPSIKIIWKKCKWQKHEPLTLARDGQ
jgi:hypothetical protein